MNKILRPLNSAKMDVAAGNSGSADGRQMKIDMGMNGSRAVGKHDDTAVTQTNPLSKDRSVCISVAFTE